MTAAEGRVRDLRAAHDARAFPERLRDEVPDVVLCDVAVAACTVYWQRRQKLEGDYRDVVEWVAATLSHLGTDLADRREREFVGGLLAVARALLE